MERKEIAHTDYFVEVMKAMTARGLLLAAYDGKGKPNAMAIGWGTIGSVWSMPLWIVLVRPSRYTYECIEHSGAFSVNVPGPYLAEAVDLCGTRSGRDGDKLAEAHLTAEKGQAVAAPTLAQCPIVYECSVVHRNDVVPGYLAQQIADDAYPSGDYHRVYFGKILSARAAENAVELLA